ncbi:cyclin [Tieghemostelium lacteum]|uniref:Cyclin n=1 Tax=Tieghemostelium lacteum TaxID=361077 RepID=A0A151Z9B0_TIELA|nr:cyclin [Tieghemostelium lacteum]|eukprot:KYQ90454.1 cyclin [Tieghemostelium lacteum]
MRKSQKKTQPLDYMSQQGEIKPSMRSVLVDWIVELGMELRVKNETLFLTINYLDRYLSQTQVTKEQFQLIGASTFLIACKYEEYRAPNPYQIQVLAGNYFTVKQLFEVESHILKVLGFNLTTPTTKFFLTRYLRAVSRDGTVCALAHFYGELSLMDYDLMNQYPSIVAAACVYLALKTVNRPWTSTLTYYTRVFVDDPYFQQTVKILWELHRSNNNLFTIKQKYAQLIHLIPPLQVLTFN